MTAKSSRRPPVVYWNDWPTDTIVGNCRIRVYHDEDPPRKAVTVIAEPSASAKDWGAYIHCSLPVASPQCVTVRPPFRAYWSSRRRGDTSEYFNEYLPHVDIAVAQALRSKQFADRELAALYLVFPGGARPVDLRPGETCYMIASDEVRFEEVANAWLASRVSTSEGAASFATAQRKVVDAAEWFAALESFDPTGSEPKAAKLTQCAVYKAIRDAAFNHLGIPTLKQVRDAYRDVAIQWDELQTSRGGQKADIRIEGFDQAIKNLGFSWLPRKLSESS